MNYLIVMPRFVQNPGDAYILPLGIAYISASLKKSGRNVFTLNLNLSNSTVNDAVSDSIIRHDVDVLCVGGLSPSYMQIKGIVSTAKKLRPGIAIVIGGGMVTASPEIVMRGIEHADIGVIDEGDDSIIEIADALEHARDLAGIKGIVFKRNGEIVKTEKRTDIRNLDDLPFPDYEGFCYDPGIGGGLICASRSCPFDCSFCFHSCGRTYRKRSLDNIFSEIDYLVGRYAVKSIGILDELFSLDKARMEEFCDRIRPYGLTWSCQMRVDGMDRNTLRKIKKAGCNVLSIGIESASDKVLRSMNKKITISQVDRAIESAKSAGVNLVGNLLFGDKEDDLESFRENVRWLNAHPDLNIGFLRTLILPGSPLYRYAVENNYIADETEYLENGYYTINVTRLSDEEYNKCLDLMECAVLQRNYSAKDILIEGLIEKKKGFRVGCLCPSCGSKNHLDVCDFFGLENFHCGKCGQLFNINLSFIVGDVVAGKLEAISSDSKVIIWGMGTVGKKMAACCESIPNENIRLIDRNPLMQGKSYGRRSVSAPESIDFDAAYVLFGTSLMQKTGEAIPNTVGIETIRSMVNALPVHVGAMMGASAFAFDAVAESGKYPFL